MFDKDPLTGYQVVSDYKNNMTDIHINQQRLIEDIKKECHVLLVGYKAREKAWWILNELKDEFNIKVVMPIETDEEWATPIPKQSNMPNWATPIPTPIDISEGFGDRDVIFYDELNIFSVSSEKQEESIYESLRYSSRVIYMRHRLREKLG